MPPLLEVKELHTEFRTGAGLVRAVDGISYTVEQGETVAIVGESGSGKSVGALSILRLIPDPPGRVTAGEILFDGRDLRGLSEPEMREIRGRDIGMVFQEPMTSLNPVLTIGRQITEVLEQHQGADGPTAERRALELLEMVGIADAGRRLKQYPHQLSGGMRQRVMIAIALACSPKLIIADEPTTALDVTIQAQILELMKSLTVRLNVALIVITHNLGVVARYASRVNVMYAGRIVEAGSAEAVYHNPRHPYTMALLRSVPRLDRPRQARLDPVDGQPPDLTRLDGGCAFRPRCRFAIDKCAEAAPAAGAGRRGRPSRRLLPERRAPRGAGRRRMNAGEAVSPLLEVRGLAMHFPISEGIVLSRKVGDVKAVDGVDFTINRGETLGLVGESGCGKTTTGRCILRLERPTAGQILFDGRDISHLERKEMVALRRRMQVIFQDPYSSLNPRMKVGDIVGEPIKVHGVEPDAAGAARGCASCCRFAASIPSSPTAIRTRCRVASGKGLASPARWRSIRSSSSATRRCRPSTCRSRPRSSICWRICASDSGSPICSSRTTCRSFAISASGSPSCISDGSSRWPRATSCSTIRCIPTPRPCFPRCRCPTRVSRRRANSARPRARCRARSIRRPVASSIHAARWRWRAASRSGRC